MTLKRSSPRQGNPPHPARSQKDDRAAGHSDHAPRSAAVVNHRTAVISQIRGLLLDRGFAFARSITRARRTIPVLLSDMTNGLAAIARETIAELCDLMCDLDRRVSALDKKIDAVFKADPACQRIARIKGVGPKTATAMVAAVGPPAQRRSAQFGLDRLNADQGTAKVSLAPHMPNMMTKATSPAAVAPVIRKRSAKRRVTPCASSTDRPPAARCERTKKTARP